MTDIISEIFNIEAAAAEIAEKARKKTDELEKNTHVEIDRVRCAAQERAKKNAVKIDEKLSAETTDEINKINVHTKHQLQKMQEYYNSNREKIISELFDKALNI